MLRIDSQKMREIMAVTDIKSLIAPIQILTEVKNRNMRTIVRTDQEIDQVLNKAADGINEGSCYPGMSYEQGIQAFADWVFGDTEDAPFEED